MGLLRKHSKGQAKTARSEPEILLCIIDWQKFFVHPSSPGFISDTRFAAEKIRRLLAEFRNSGLPVIATRHSNSATEPGSFLRFYGKVITPGSRWFDLGPPLNRINHLRIFDKHTYSVFENQEISSYLSTLKVRRMVLAGVQTDKCILASALAGFDRGLEMVVLSDACSSRKKFRHRAALNLMKASCATVIEVEDLIRMMKKERQDESFLGSKKKG